MHQRQAYRSAYPISYLAGRDVAYVVSPTARTVRELTPSLAAMLRMCRGCRTIEAHREAILRGGGHDSHRVDDGLRLFLEHGLLESCSDLATIAHGACDERTRQIDTVAVITHDRPGILHRCLESIADNLRAHGHQPRILIVGWVAGLGALRTESTHRLDWRARMGAPRRLRWQTRGRRVLLQTRVV